MTLADRFKDVRKTLGLSQRKMVEELGSSLGAIQAYEAGTSVPGGNVLEALARMGVNIDWLLTGEGEMEKSGGLKVKSRRITATEIMARSHEELSRRYIEPLFEAQRARDQELGALVRLINHLNNENLFKLIDVVEEMLDLQEKEADTESATKEAR